MADQPAGTPGLEQALARRERQLLGLHEASLALSQDLELTSLLQRVADLSREVIGTRYAALGVLDDAEILLTAVLDRAPDYVAARHDLACHGR